MGQGHPQPRHTPSTTAGGELGAQGTRAPSPAAGPHAPPQPPGPAGCLQLLSPRSPAGLPPEGDRALHRVAGPGSQPKAGRTPPPHAPWGQRCQEGCSGYHGGSPPLHPTSCSPSRVTQSHNPHRKAEGRLHFLLTLPHLHGVLGGGLSFLPAKRLQGLQRGGTARPHPTHHLQLPPIPDLHLCTMARCSSASPSEQTPQIKLFI